MASHYEAPIRKPLVTGDKSYHDVTVDVAAPVEGNANKQWWIAMVHNAAFVHLALLCRWRPLQNLFVIKQPVTPACNGIR